MEVKKNDCGIPAAMKYFGAKLKIPYQYLIAGNNMEDYVQEGVRVMSVKKFLSGLV